MALSMEGTGAGALAQTAAGHPAAAKTKENHSSQLKNQPLLKGNKERGEKF